MRKIKMFSKKIKIILMVVLQLSICSCKKSDIISNTENSSIVVTPDAPMKDYAGNTYKTVKIGNQIWMAENLKTTKLNDGQPIPNVTGMAEWGNLTTPGLCWGNNNPSNKDAFGGLYNWHAVNSGKLAPNGWHIPSKAEWEILITFLGGESIAGGKMKTTSKWFQPNLGGTNESGFSAVPVDYRNYDGYIFWNPGDGASFWSATEVNDLYALGIRLNADSRECKIYESGVKKTYGYSIRCVKD